MNYDLSFVVTAITVTCYSWATSSDDRLFTCDVIYPPPHWVGALNWVVPRCGKPKVCHCFKCRLFFCEVLSCLLLQH